VPLPRDDSNIIDQTMIVDTFGVFPRQITEIDPSIAKPGQPLLDLQPSKNVYSKSIKDEFVFNVGMIS
jgi:hypothetical protein